MTLADDLKPKNGTIFKSSTFSSVSMKTTSTTSLSTVFGLRVSVERQAEFYAYLENTKWCSL